MRISLEYRVVDGWPQLELVEVLPVVVAYQIAIEVDVRDQILPALTRIGSGVDEWSVLLDDRRKWFRRGRHALIDIGGPGQARELMKV